MIRFMATNLPTLLQAARGMMQSAAMVVMTYCMVEQVMTHYKVVQVKIPWQAEPETTD